MGLPILECAEGAERIQTGDELEIDLDSGTIENHTRKETYRAEAVPPFMQRLLAAGGLMEYVRDQIAEEKSR
jgi:3-isopropylmalate dehydratase small subunit